MNNNKNGQSAAKQITDMKPIPGFEDYLISKLKIRSILIKVITFITLISILICIWFAYILEDNYNTAKKEHIWDSETTIIEE